MTASRSKSALDRASRRPTRCSAMVDVVEACAQQPGQLGERAFDLANAGRTIDSVDSQIEPRGAIIAATHEAGKIDAAHEGSHTLPSITPSRFWRWVREPAPSRRTRKPRLPFKDPSVPFRRKTAREPGAVRSQRHAIAGPEQPLALALGFDDDVPLPRAQRQIGEIFAMACLDQSDAAIEVFVGRKLRPALTSRPASASLLASRIPTAIDAGAPGSARCTPRVTFHPRASC